MGGPGSGRRFRFGTRSTIEEYRRLDVRAMGRAGVLTAGYAGSWQWSQGGKKIASIRIVVTSASLIVAYRHRSGNGGWVEENYPIHLTRTPCNFGGSRPWFRCPAQGCGRRVAILYGGGVFACCRCYGLAYTSSRESPSDRASRRADKLRVKLGWEPGILNERSGKPKWMRWRTFQRLSDKHDLYADRSLAEMLQSILKFSALD